jgi:hypothetical protein
MQSSDSPHAVPDDPTPAGRASHVPDPAAPRNVPLPAATAIERWFELQRHLSSLLKDEAPTAAWIERLHLATIRLRDLALNDADTAVYVLLQAAGHDVDGYSAHHSMLCAVVCELCAKWMDWSSAEIESLVRAALTMNLSMSTMRDSLAKQVGPLSEALALLLERCPPDVAMRIAESVREAISGITLTWERRLLRVGASMGSPR